MKKLLSFLLALTLVLICAFAMTACKEDEDPKKESEAEEASSAETVSESKEYVLADGYKLFDKDGVSFAYTVEGNDESKDATYVARDGILYYVLQRDGETGEVKQDNLISVPGGYTGT